MKYEDWQKKYEDILEEYKQAKLDTTELKATLHEK